MINFKSYIRQPNKKRGFSEKCYYVFGDQCDNKVNDDNFKINETKNANEPAQDDLHITNQQKQQQQPSHVRHEKCNYGFLDDRNNLSFQLISDISLCSSLNDVVPKSTASTLKVRRTSSKIVK